MSKGSNAKHSLGNILKAKKNKTFKLYENHKPEPYIKDNYIVGRVSSIRSMGKSLFFDILNHHNIKKQVYYRFLNLNSNYVFLEKVIKCLSVGDVVRVYGTYFKTKTQEVTLNLTKLNVISKTLKNGNYPNNTGVLEQTIIRLRGLLFKNVRSFFYKNRFIEVETPVFQKNPGGALAKPFKTFRGGTVFYLRISLEIYLKKLIVNGCNRVFEVGRVFRNEGSSLTHSNEFTMLEAYSSFSKYGFMVKLVYSLIQEVAYRGKINNYVYNRGKVLYLGGVWRVFNYQETIRIFTKLKNWFSLNDGSKKNHCLSIGVRGNFNITKIKNIDNFIFDKFISDKLIQPTFIIKFPRKLCPLAKLNNLNSCFTDIFELYIGGMELSPGYSEQTDPFIQSKLLIKQNKYRRDLYDKKFIDSLTKGMPFLSGIGIGIDRLVMILSNSSNIKRSLIS